LRKHSKHETLTLQQFTYPTLSCYLTTFCEISLRVPSSCTYSLFHLLYIYLSAYTNSRCYFLTTLNTLLPAPKSSRNTSIQVFVDLVLYESYSNVQVKENNIYRFQSCRSTKGKSKVCCQETPSSSRQSTTPSLSALLVLPM